MITKEQALEFAVSKNVTYLFKDFLRILEEISEEHAIQKHKIRGVLPEQYKDYVSLADFLPPEKQALLRKRVLDAGNESRRNLTKEILEIENNFR